MMSTPTKPTMAAIQRRTPTFSPRNGPASAVTNSGTVNQIATMLASGMDGKAR